MTSAMRLSAIAALTLIQQVVASAAALIRRRYDILKPSPVVAAFLRAAGSAVPRARRMRQIVRASRPCRFVSRLWEAVQSPDREIRRAETTHRRKTSDG